jgi:preprotein translocase subunit SecG
MLVILLQQGKGGDIASAFGGGGSQTAFGARSGATVLSRATAIGAVLFTWRNGAGDSGSARSRVGRRRPSAAGRAGLGAAAALGSGTEASDTRARTACARGSGTTGARAVITGSPPQLENSRSNGWLGSPRSDIVQSA